MCRFGRRREPLPRVLASPQFLPTDGFDFRGETVPGFGVDRDRAQHLALGALGGSPPAGEYRNRVAKNARQFSQGLYATAWPPGGTGPGPKTAAGRHRIRPGKFQEFFRSQGRGGTTPEKESKAYPFFYGGYHGE